jgi:Putative prokaryotic signal transducing protein
MEELLRTNDLVLISYAEALLRDAGIDFIVLDQNMSVIEGSLGILPRRVLVAEDWIVQARSLLEKAGIGAELVKPKKAI